LLASDPFPRTVTVHLSGCEGSVPASYFILLLLVPARSLIREAMGCAHSHRIHNVSPSDKFKPVEPVLLDEPGRNSRRHQINKRRT